MRKAEIEAAWERHNLNPDAFECQNEKDFRKQEAVCPQCNKLVKLNWKGGQPFCSEKKCGEKLNVLDLGHSRFNKACQRKVKEFAKKYPIPRQLPEEEEEEEMVRCDKCKRQKKSDKIKEFKGQYVQGNFCNRCYPKVEKMEKRKRITAERELEKELKQIEVAKKECKMKSGFGHFDREIDTCMRCEHKTVCHNNPASAPNLVPSTDHPAQESSQQSQDDHPSEQPSP